MGNERINIISNKGRRQHNQLNIYIDNLCLYRKYTKIRLIKDIVTKIYSKKKSLLIKPIEVKNEKLQKILE